LVTDLSSGGDGDVVDALRGKTWIATQQLSQRLDYEVVGAHLFVHPSGPPEGGADPIDENDVASKSWHAASFERLLHILLVSNYGCLNPVL
jgi:hypothetical protein